MRSEIYDRKHEGLRRYLRRCLEYTLAIGTALLCSYWILQGRW
jgi:hypothetical protein